jgi:hypothetical protein
VDSYALVLFRSGDAAMPNMIAASEIRRVVRFIKEREQIRVFKEQGLEKPWTKDPILLNYRFTNVRREDDKVTKWIAENWREQHNLDRFVWFAVCVARYINWPPTLEKIGYPVPFNAARVCKLLNKIAGKKVVRSQTQMSGQVFGGAYFLNSIGPKIESIVNDRLKPLWENREVITAHLGACELLEEVYQVFRAQHGFGSFMAAQIVADLKYTPQFRNVKDWMTFAAPGPGSKRGLNRLCGRPINAPWKDSVWLETLHEFQKKLNKEINPPLHAQDVQGIFCETDKYLRVKNGEGRPKARYAGS